MPAAAFTRAWQHAEQLGLHVLQRGSAGSSDVTIGLIDGPLCTPTSR